MNGMHSKKVKVAISLQAGLLKKVKSIVAHKRSKSVSAYIEHAIGAQLAAEADFDDLSEQRLAQTGGPPTSAERAEARKLLRGAA
jgi:metal-responsive CopG/Arc/MetJ family transcriptional regulator